MNEETLNSTFAAGIAILDPLLVPNDFHFHTDSPGRSSGGLSTSGFYQRGDRKLELHLRYSLGLVAYHLGLVSLSHEDYMWAVIGKRGASSYPGFSQDPLDGFRHLFRDLDEHGSAFLAGSDDEFLALADRVAVLRRTVRPLPS